MSDPLPAAVEETLNDRQFECFFNFLGWWQWSFGFHLDIRHPHIDLHVPFGYLRIGWYSEAVAIYRIHNRPARAFVLKRYIYRG